MKTVVNHLTLSYTDRGSGEAVVFLHAFPLSQEMWRPQVEALAPHYRVVTLDLRGHGGSGVVLWNESLDVYAADVMGLLDDLGIARATFVGLSMGGYILFALYRNYANRVRAMVLADTRAQADSEDGRAGRRAMAQAAYQQGADSIADMMLPKLLGPSTREHHKKIVEEIRAMIVKTTPAGIITDLMAMAARPDSTPLLATITCPTLIVVGEEDAATPPSESAYLHERIRNSQLLTIPRAGHLSNYEQPDAFNHALREFLDSLPPS